MIDCKAVKNVEIFSWQLIPNVAVAVAYCVAAVLHILNVLVL